VVAVVVAVGGRSADARETAAPEVGGSFPVNSSFRIRDLRSSSSSQTVDGAVVDAVDSVPSAMRGVSGESSTSTVFKTRGEEWYTRGAEYDKLACREECVRVGIFPFESGKEGRRPPWVSCDSYCWSWLLVLLGEEYLEVAGVYLDLLRELIGVLDIIRS
jgi:hypothetical protein